LATAPGTARLIFSGEDGSTSGDSSKIVKLIAQLQWFTVGRLAGFANVRQRHAERLDQPANPDRSCSGHGSVPTIGMNGRNAATS
jgi:hypothetical protein